MEEKFVLDLLAASSSAKRPIKRLYPWVEYIPFTYWLIQYLQPKVFVELGVHDGDSYFSFCDSAQQCLAGTTCYGIDLWHGDTTFKDITTLNQPYSSFSKLIRSTFKKALTSFVDGSIDLLLIDGNYEYEAVKSDFNMWRPKMSPHGIILLHGTELRRDEFGVWRFWNELKKEYPNTFTFFHGHGLGILNLNPVFAPSIFWNTFTEPELKGFTLYFQNLGRLLSLSSKDREGENSDNDAINHKAQADQTRLEAEYGRRLAEQGRQQAEMDVKAAMRARRRADKSRLQAEHQAEFAKLTLLHQKEQTDLEIIRLKRLVESAKRWQKRSWIERAFSRWESESTNSVPLLKRLEKSIRIKLRKLVGTKKVQSLNPSRLVNSTQDVTEQQTSKLNGLFDKSWYLKTYSDVASLGLDPLKHYIERGAQEGRNPNALFDTRWYLKTYPDVAKTGINPLEHYIQSGAHEARKPNPLFDTRWYLETYPDIQGLTPLEHYITIGAMKELSPYPLFDGKWYLENYRGVIQPGLNPLEDYLDVGAIEGRKPNPIFDSDWYLDNYPEVYETQLNPLEHYMEIGAKKGYKPCRSFDGTWYTETYPDVAQTNPLEHYLRVGQREKRRTSPLSDVEPDVKSIEIVRMSEPKSFGTQTDLKNQRKQLLFISNASPVSIRASYHSRLRLLRWFKSEEWNITLLIYLNDDDDLIHIDIQSLADFCNFLILRDRTFITNLALSEPALRSIYRDSHIFEHIQLDHEAFSGFKASCPPRFLRLIRTLLTQNTYNAVIAHNTLFAPVFRLFPTTTLKILDTLDLFSKGKSAMITENEEITLLRNADLITSQDVDEITRIQRLGFKTIFVGVDFDIPETISPISKSHPTLVINEGDNPLNQKGIQAFLEYSWPLVLEALPEAQLNIVGSLATFPRTIRGVNWLGEVENLHDAYSQAWLAINPVPHGIGVNIHTREALSHFRRVVAYPAGVHGLDPALHHFCTVVHDVIEMAHSIIDLLSHHARLGMNEADIKVIRSSLSSDVVYKDLKAVLTQHA